MQYLSTRNNGLYCTCAEAIVKGLSPEGGLFVPEEFPKLSENDIEQLAKLSYNERAVNILSKYLTDFKAKEIRECVDSAYSKEKFETESIAPIYKLNDTTYILELWHGPTFAFKDMALQILPHLLTVSMQKTGISDEVVILVATSGDTGKAALEGFKDVQDTKIMVFYPEDGVSQIQKLQMITQSGENVCVCGVKGNFDDAQSGVKAVFTDDEYRRLLKVRGYILSSANSINWGRLVPQIVYYFSAYADLLKNEEIEIGEKINITVPTGNFGNILAAYYAKRMGLPVGKLICASNANNVLTEFINTGVYNRNRDLITTISPSMDILISNNLERLLFDISGGDANLISLLMNRLRIEGKYEVPSEYKTKIKEIFWAGFCDDSGAMETIRKTNEQYAYVLDTHTAVAKNVYDQYVKETGDMTKCVIASTASPFKFSQSVLSALGEDITGKDGFELLEVLSKLSGLKIPPTLLELKTLPVRFAKVCEKDGMKAAVDEFLT